MYKGVLKSSLPDQEETKNRFMMLGQTLRSELRKKKKKLYSTFSYIYCLIQTDQFFQAYANFIYI